MPKVSGIFDKVANIDQIPVADIAQWLHPAPNEFYIENYLANLILYSQIIPVKTQDLDLELAILREVLRRIPNLYHAPEKKLVVPTAIINRYNDLTKLIWVFVDAYKTKDITSLVVQETGAILGSVVTPRFETKGGSIELIVEDKKYQIKKGSLTAIPCAKNHCHISFKSKEATILEKKEAILEAYGGKVGLIIDGRGYDLG